MRVTANYSNPAKSPVAFTAKKTNKSLQTNHNPAFKRVLLNGLKMKEIEALYEDGPAMARMIKKIAPAFNEKFGDLFTMYLEVFPDFYRSILPRVSVSHNEVDQMKKYIINNNKEIKLPQFIMYEWERGGNNYDNFLYGDSFYPLQNVSFTRDGEQKTLQRFLDFIKHNDKKTIVRALYEQNPPQIITKNESSYLKHSSNIYGNPAV